MERLTEKNYKAGDGYYMKCSEGCRLFSCEECERFGEEVDRLGQIEDILGDTYNLDRLRELVEADKAGRALIVTDEMATAMRAGAFVLCRKGSKKLLGAGLDWMPREGKTLYIPYRKAADMLKEAAEAALEKEAAHMSERKTLTDEQLDSIWKEMLKPDAKKPPRLDRSVWEPCRRCKTCQSCKSSICSLNDKSSGCYDCDHMGNYEPMGFCPWCGRPLTDAAWEMLERRIARHEQQ